jgi:hypothetical protein
MEFVVAGIIVWLILCALAATIADTRGRHGWSYFVIAFVFSPLVGILLAALLPPIQANIEKKQIAAGTSRKCPHCAELIKPDAKVCKHCGRDVPSPSTAD